MKAETHALKHLFNRPVSYVVPLFQRPYVWRREAHWAPLWEDIRAVTEKLLALRARDAAEGLEAGQAEQDTPPHFLGAVVLEQVPFGGGMIERRHVIDGQQRMTTLQLFVDAAHDVADERDDPSARLFAKLTDNDPDLIQELSDHYKVWPTNFDVTAFRATMAKDPGAVPDSAVTGSSLWEAHEFFTTSIRDWLDEDHPESPKELLDALRTVAWELLRVVVIDLEGNDNAQVIFETLNARGTPLLASDLIKNAIFQQANSRRLATEELYERHWKALDADSWRREIRQGRLIRPRLDLFFFHWLTMRLGREFAVHDLFQEFKRYAAAHEGGPSAVLEDIAHHAAVYRQFEEFAAGSEEERFFYRLAALETNTAMPLLLFVLGSDDAKIPAEEKVLVLRSIESWLVRRMLCRLTTKNYNAVFMGLLPLVKAELATAGQVTVAYLRRIGGESRLWPTDEEVEAALRVLPLYRTVGRGRLRFVLEAVEDSLRPKGVEQAHTTRNLTIEHILPQKWEQNWKELPADMPGVEARQRRNTMLHTIGNLTLVTGSLNSKASNASWPDKRVTLERHTVLYLNRDVVAGHDRWDEEAIAQRGASLSGTVLRIWPGPESEVWGAEFELDRALLSAEDLEDLGADDDVDEGSGRESWTHDEIRSRLRVEALAPIVDGFEEWATSQGLTIRHNRRSNHALHFAGRRLGGYYFNRGSISFHLRGWQDVDASLDRVPGVQGYRRMDTYVRASVHEPVGADAIKTCILARVS